MRPPLLLPASSRTPKPWKNGGGVTADVLVMPSGAGLDDFAVRISIAEVAASGPFSRFAGIDRSTAILEGAGFVLTVAGRQQRLSAEDAPLAYPGDVPTEAELIDGATVDLNVMTRRGVATHRLERVRLAPGETTAVPAGSVVIWAQGAGTIIAGVNTVALGRRDAVVIHTPSIITAASAVTVFVVVFALAPAPRVPA